MKTDDNGIPYVASARLHAQKRYEERTGTRLSANEYRKMLAWVKHAPVIGHDIEGRDLIEVPAPQGRLFAVLDRRVDRIVTFIPKMESRHVIKPLGETAIEAAFLRAKQRSIDNADNR